MFEAPIAIGLSPNTQNNDVWQAFRVFFQPWLWKTGEALREVEAWFKDYLNCESPVFFNSARSALYAVLKSFDIGAGDEVLIQAFTCVAVPDPIIWSGAKPIYIDIDDTLNIDPDLLEQHINSKTRAIIIQHTFGIPAKIKLIKKIAQKHDLILIEDCAHSLGAEVDGQKIGTLGDAAIFSFGRDKVISSVFGGAAIINPKSKIKNQKLKKLHERLDYPCYFWIFQQLLHPIAFALILPLYDLYLGKLVLFILQKLHLLSKPIYKEEPSGGKPAVFPKRYPNALAELLLVQLGKLDIYNKKRQQIADYYFDKLKERGNITLPPKEKGIIYLRFNIKTSKAQEFLVKAKKEGILLGNWYRNIIDPKSVDYGKIGYKIGLCPNAEKIAKLSVNLPTYPRLTQDNLELVIKLF